MFFRAALHWLSSLIAKIAATAREPAIVAASLVMIFASSICPAKIISSAAGLDLGGNGSILLSDKSVGAFGLGAGLQGSAFFTMWKDHPIAAKMRIESISMKEVSVQKTPTDYLLPGSSLKSATQGWTLLSAGAEGSFGAEGQSFFWEALLGYAFGQSATVTVTTSVPDGALIDTPQQTSSGWALSGGVGIKRQFGKLVMGLMSLRTVLFLGSPYTTNPLTNKAFIPLPLEFNVGVEFPFSLGN